MEENGVAASVALSTNKKVVIRRFEREAINGFVTPQSYLQDGGVEVLTLSGTALVVPYPDIKALYFVRDFEGPDVRDENRLFHTRPKMNGIWIRMKFRDGDLMDGLIPNNLLQLEPHGYTFVPPSPTANNQKVFVPRAALVELQVVGVVGSPLRIQKPKPRPKEQIELFE